MIHGKKYFQQVGIKVQVHTMYLIFDSNILKHALYKNFQFPDDDIWKCVEILKNTRIFNFKMKFLIPHQDICPKEHLTVL